MSRKHRKEGNSNRDVAARAEAHAKQVANLPMNKEFLQATNEDGTPMYPIVDKLVKYKMMDYDRIEDHMRQVAAYIAQIRHHQARIYDLTEQYAGRTPVTEKNEYGRLLTKPEIQLMIVSEKIAVPRDISKIREFAVDKLLPLVDGIKFTGAMYNEYIVNVQKQVGILGYELFPSEIKLIVPEFG